MDLVVLLTLKVPITTAADDKFFDTFPIFEKNKVRYFTGITCQQTFLMKYHALFVIFEKAAKFLIVVAVDYRWRFIGKTHGPCNAFNP